MIVTWHSRYTSIVQDLKKETDEYAVFESLFASSLLRRQSVVPEPSIVGVTSTTSPLIILIPVVRSTTMQLMSLFILAEENRSRQPSGSTTFNYISICSKISNFWIRSLNFFPHSRLIPNRMLFWFCLPFEEIYFRLPHWHAKRKYENNS